MKSQKELESLAMIYKDNILDFCFDLGIDPIFEERQILYAYSTPEYGTMNMPREEEPFWSCIMLMHFTLTHTYAKTRVILPTYVGDFQQKWLESCKKIVNGPKAQACMSELFHFDRAGFGVLGCTKSQWGCYGMNNQSARQQGLAGIHSKYMCFLVDTEDVKVREAAVETTLNNSSKVIHLQ